MSKRFSIDKNLHFISRENGICYAVGTYAGYIYRRESNWNIYPGEYWALIDFWPSHKEIAPFDGPNWVVPRLLKFEQREKWTE